MKKRIPLFLSIIFIISGTILLIPSVIYLLQRILDKQFVTNISTVGVSLLAVISFLADTLGIVSFVSNLLKKEPPALVTIPATFIGKKDFPIVGRDNDLNWLGTVGQDSLLVGQPGSGKTFLLYKFAKDNSGLFVERNDINLIVNEYKKKRPKFIIIDDAEL